jgi:PAS domain S-box-containing protein
MLVDAVTNYAIYMLDPQGIITSWNAGAKRFKGYEEAEILGESFSRFYTDEDRKADLPRRALEIAEREGKFESDGWRVRKDGTRFRAYVVISPIRDNSGNLVGFAKVTRDLTERVKAQRALDETREALLQAQKMEAIGHLTGGIAHDFNNLLMAIQGSLELLQRRLPRNDPKIVQLLDNAVRGAQRGAALTQRMLAFAPRRELKLVALDVPKLVQGMTELLQSSLGPAIRIETHFPPKLSRARADPHQLELSLLNLVVNARDAMPKGGAIVIGAREGKMRDEPGLKPGHYICLTVTDTGIGMDEATLMRAMEPFFTTKGIGKGTGLGLPMVHGMAQQSGGKLVLKSKPAFGTTVELYLAAALPDAASVEEQIAPRASIPPERTLTILAVDDDPLVAINTFSLLEGLGHMVYSALSGSQALEILHRDREIDLVITDQAMPGMTGLELVTKIRAEKPELPVILAAGYAELSPGEGQGIPRLAKPFRQGDLADAIARMIARRQVKTPA